MFHRLLDFRCKVLNPVFFQDRNLLLCVRSRVQEPSALDFSRYRHGKEESHSAKKTAILKVCG